MRSLERHLESVIVRGDVLGKKGLVNLGTLRKNSCSEGDPETASEVSHEAENPCCVAHLLHAYINERCRTQRNKKHPKANSLDEPRQGYRNEVTLEVEIGHHG